MNKSYKETNETLQKSFKVHASQATTCQCNDTFIFRLLAQSSAAMLTGHKIVKIQRLDRKLSTKVRKEKFTFVELVKDPICLSCLIHNL